MKKSQSLTYNFSLTNNFTDIVKLSQLIYFLTITSLYSGNHFLEIQFHKCAYVSLSLACLIWKIFLQVTYTKQILLQTELL
jgi:hypothetical protein